MMANGVFLLSWIQTGVFLGLQLVSNVGKEDGSVSTKYLRLETGLPGFQFGSLTPVQESRPE